MSSEPVKRETRSVKSHKSEPVHKLFNHYTGILKILINDKKGVNEIDRQLKESKEPGFAHKPSTIKAIRHLEKGALIKRSKQIDSRHKRSSGQKRRRQQKKIMELTELGSELANLIESIDKYREYYFKLTSLIKKYFDTSDNNKKEISKSEFRHRLEKIGWSRDDMEKYSSWSEETFQFEYLSSFAIFDALMARYALIIFKYNPEGIAKEILNKLVVDTLREYIMARVEGLSERSFTDRMERESILFNIFDQLSGRTFSYFSMFAPPEKLNKFIQNESIGLVESLYSILSPSKDFLIQEMGRWASKNPKVKEQLKFLEGLDKSP